MALLTEERINKFGLPVILLLALALRLTNLTYTSLWQDEIYSLMVATMHNTIPVVLDTAVHPASWYLQSTAWQPIDFWKLIEILKDNVHMPLYFVLLNPWLKIFGVSAWGLRSFSVLCSVLMLPFLYWLSRDMFNERVALWATFIAAVAPFQIYYAQEGRMYALVTLWAVISTWCFWKVLFAEKPAKWSVCYAVSVVLGVLTHYIFVFFLGFHAVAGVFLYPKIMLKQKRGLWFLIAMVLTGLIGLWWYPVYHAQKLAVDEGYQFAKGAISLLQAASAPGWQMFVSAAGNNEIIRVFYSAFMLFGVVFGSYYLILKFKRHGLLVKRPKLGKMFGNWLCFAWIFIPALLMAFYDVVHQTHMSLVDRYSVLIAPAVYISLAFALVRWGRIFRLHKIVVGVWTLMLLLAIGNVWVPSPLRDEHNKKDIREKMEYMVRHAGPNDLILATGVSGAPILGAYYLQDVKPGQPMMYWEKTLRGKEYPLPDVVMLRRYKTIWVLKVRAIEERGGEDLDNMLRGNFPHNQHTEHWDIYSTGS